jgi:hypothetical protein
MLERDVSSQVTLAAGQVKRTADQVERARGQDDFLARGALRLDERAALFEQSNRLAHEQRHALGAREQLRREFRRRRPPDPLREQLGDVGARKRRERDLGAAVLCA